MDIFTKKTKKYKLDLKKKSKEHIVINKLINVFDLFTKYNMNIDRSNLIIKNYNRCKKNINVVNENEFKLISDFIFENKEILPFINNNIKESKEACIILHGYKKCLIADNFIEFDIFEFIKNSKINNLYHLDSNNDFKIIKKKLNYYKKNYDNRYNYYFTIIFYYKDKEINKLPIYLDYLGSFNIYQERNIFKNYFSFVNVTKGFLFYEFNKINKKSNIYYYYNNDIIKYKLEDELCSYEDFDSYLNEEYLKELEYLEENY